MKITKFKWKIMFYKLNDKLSGTLKNFRNVL